MYLSNICIKIHLERLRYNLRILRSRYPKIMPVIKADAYGHGILIVANVLRDEGIQCMAVGSVSEGFLLRKEGHKAFLLALLGILSKEDAVIAARYDITPVIHSSESLQAIAAHSHLSTPSDTRLSIAVKIDTGMGRLGFPAEEYASLIELLRNTPQVKPVLLVSHFASSDLPEYDRVTHEQVKRFITVYEAIKEIFPDIKTSLANSPGILAWPKYIGDFARPGLALYGGNPLYGTSRTRLGKGLLPVMEVDAPILATTHISMGSSIGYGCTYTATKDMRIAIVGVGYADGYSRNLSNKAWMLINGKRAQVVGRICMQVCMVDITDNHTVSIGDTAYLLGGEGTLAIKPEELAEWWGTVPHEVFCAFGTSTTLQKKILITS